MSLRIPLMPTQRPKLHIMLNSGGMDSLLIHDHVLNSTENEYDEYLSVFIDYGQSYCTKEKAAARDIAEAYGIPLAKVRCSHLARYEHKTGIVPFRNAELLLTAAQYGITTHLNVLYMGVLAHEVNSDKSRGFIRHMQHVLNISHQPQYWTAGKEYVIRTPLRRFTKTEALRRCTKRGTTDPGLLLNTVSCYSDTLRPCGKCASCFKRWVALTNNGMMQVFEARPWKFYDVDELRSKLRGYHRDRRREIEAAYEKIGIIL